MNLDPITEGLLVSSFFSFVVYQTWQSVCVILIFSSLKFVSAYFAKVEKPVDIKGLEAKIAQTQSDIKAVNFKLGFAR